MSNRLTAGHGWAILGGYILVWEISCQREHLLSEGADRGIARAPVLTRIGIFIVAAHLANVIPEKYDPIHRLATLKQ